MSRDALIVGINKYKYITSLKASANDAEAVAQRLESQFRVRRFPESFDADKQPMVATSAEVNAMTLEEMIADLFLPDGKDIPKTALFYFSGHGLRKPSRPKKGFLATSDTNPRVNNWGIDLKWLREVLSDSPIREQIVWLDCCYSGELFDCRDADPGDRGDGKSRCFLSASRSFEVAYEDIENPLQSVFTQSLTTHLDPTKAPAGKVTNLLLTERITSEMQTTLQAPIQSNTGAPILLTFTTQATPDPQPAPEPKRYAPRQGEKLPANYVPRPEPFAAVKTLLLQETTTANTLVVSAILGLGGIGKSVLAAALAADPEIQQRFPNGTLWVTLGQNPDLLPMLGDWIQALGDYNYKPLTPEAASAHLRTLLYDRQMLLVVDDVWNPVHLDPFRVGGAGSCVLVTTREAKITDAQKYDLDVMTPDEAMALITNMLDTPLTKREAQQAGAFAKRVGYLPLALELATAQIEDKEFTWEELLNDFQREVNRLQILDRLTNNEEPDEAKRREYSLLACFNLSLQRLTPEQQACFAWLGVLPEDADITQQMGKTLWQLTERQAGEVLKTFRGKALLKGERPTYRLHDLMHDLARQLLTSPTAPEKVGSLVGLGLTEPEAHGQLLARYRRQTEAGQWHTLIDDGHIYTHLTWHMLQAEMPQQIHELLQETTEAGRNGWYEACDAIGKPALFASDVGRGWQLASADCDNLGRAIPLQVRYAFIRTSLNSMANNIPREMVGGLLKAKKWQPAQALAYAQQTQDPWRRAEYLAELALYTTPAILPEVLNTLAQINDMSYRSFVLARLAPLFPELWSEAIDSIAQIRDKVGTRRDFENGFPHRAFALSQVVPHVPEEYLPQALNLTGQISDKSDRARALSVIARHLPELWEEVLNLTNQISDESDRARTLGAIAQHLPEHLWEEALNLTRQIKDEFNRAFVLIAIAQRLPELWEEALDLTRQISDESNRAQVLIAIAQHLPGHLWEEALDLTRQISNESNRARALSAIAQHLPEHLWEEVFELTRQISNEFSRAYALSEIAQRLPEHLWEEALELTRQISDESNRARTLSAIAQHLPDVWEEVFNLARQISDCTHRAYALSEIAQHLPEHLWEEVLELTRQISDESHRARALSEIAGYLPELREEALDLIRQIGDEYLQACALSMIAQHLPELWEEALDVTRQISDGCLRAYALSEIARHLPELREEALDLIRQISDEYLQARALSEMAQCLPELWEEALDVTRQISDESHRASALSEIAQYLPELWEEALDLTRQISDESHRARAIGTIAQYLPELWEEAFALTCQINNEPVRAYTLSAITPYMPDHFQDEVLSMIWQMKDNYYRANALRGMLPHLCQKPVAFDFLSIILDLLACHERKQLVRDFAKLRVPIQTLGTEKAFLDSLQAIREVCKQWP